MNVNLRLTGRGAVRGDNRHRIVKSKGFEDEDIKLIVDDDDDCLDPSGPEVKKALQWLCTDREEDDVIFFHFSGHGTQIPCDGGT